MEIETSKGSPINTDLSKANETTRDEHSSTNIYVEGQTIRAITNPKDYKNDIDKAKQEIEDIGRTIKESVNDRGDDNRNFFGQLSETRLSETLENIAGERLKGAKDQQEIGKALEDAYRDLGYKAKVIYTDPIGDIAGAAIIANELWEMYNEQSANQQIGKRKGTMWAEQRDFAKGKTKNERKSNPDKVESAKRRYEEAKKKYEELKSKPNKTPQDKKDEKKAKDQMKRALEDLKKSENHSMRGKGQQSKGGGNKR